MSVRYAFANAGSHSTVWELHRPITFVPEAIRAVDILHALQTRGAELAIGVDEHRGTAGLVTREDLAEELFGEAIRGERAPREREIQAQPDGSVIIAGFASVRDVNRELGLRLPEADEWSTLAGLCVALACRIPTKGERFRVESGPTIEILDASPRRVRAVRVLRSPQPSTART